MAKIQKKEFFFLLDAWHYCKQYDLPMSRIVRQDWKTWVVQ